MVLQIPMVDNLKLRAEIVRWIRRFFEGRGYLEVDTPLRLPAPAPEAHIDPVASEDWFLHTSPELCMKRLLAAGVSRVFQICHVFRGGERGDRHLPEFTLLEWYRSGSDYLDLMVDCEELIVGLVQDLNGGSRLRFRGWDVDLSRPWKRTTVKEAFRKYAGVSVQDALRTEAFDALMAFAVESRLERNMPLFLYDYPAEKAALARLSARDPTTAERFELYVGGMELANAFSELTDSKEQRKRFVQENSLRRAQGKACTPLPEPFLATLDQVPECAGAALGIDRLVMLCADAPRIDEVVAFVPEDL